MKSLPARRVTVAEQIEVHFDGSIRSGQDELKAVAVGAMGKPGVTTALEIIRKEMDITMALCGKRDIADCGANILASQPF